MSTHKLLSVLSIISIGRVSSLHLLQEYVIPRTEDQKLLRIFVYEDESGPEDEPSIPINDNGMTRRADYVGNTRKLFSLFHDSTPTEDKVKAVFDLFGIPVGPYISYSRDKHEEAVADARGEPIESMYSSAGARSINGRNYETDHHREEVVRVPAKDLKQYLMLSLARGGSPASQTFPWAAEDSIDAMVPVLDENGRRNEKVTAGLQLFGVPLGPQFVYDKIDEQDQDLNDAGSGSVSETYSLATPILKTVEKLARNVITGLIFG